MAKEFSKMSLELVTHALAFKKFMDSLLPLLDKKVENLKHLMALDEKIQKFVALNKDSLKLKAHYEDLA